MNERRGFFDLDPDEANSTASSPRAARSHRARGGDVGGVRSRRADNVRSDVNQDRAEDGPSSRVTGGDSPPPRRRRRRPGGGPPRSGGPAKPRRTFLRWLLVLLSWGVQAAVALVVGIVVFDRVLMPRFVEQGSEVEVPAVHGVGLSEAKEILKQVGLEPIVTEGRYSPITDGGTILESSPLPGLLVKLGRKVFLTPSLGTATRIVPELHALSLRLANARLQTAGFEVESVDYTATDEVSPGVVLASTPSPGSPVIGDGKVSLLMSRSRRPVPFWMPDLEGRSGVDTAAWLEACGFEVRLEESSFPGRAGDVLRHEPRAGEPIYTGEQVELVLVRESDGFDDDFRSDRRSFRDR